MSTTIAGIQIPDSALARATEYIRDVESDLLSTTIRAGSSCSAP